MAEWWTLPERSLKKGEVLYMNKAIGAQAWNEQGEPWWTHWAETESPQP